MPLRILVVDDDDRTVETVSMYLVHARFEVVSCGDGKRAIETYPSMQQRALRGGSIVVRAAGTTEAAAAALRSVIRTADPGLPPGTVRTLDDMLGRTLDRGVITFVVTISSWSSSSSSAKSATRWAWCCQRKC